MHSVYLCIILYSRICNELIMRLFMTWFNSFLWNFLLYERLKHSNQLNFLILKCANLKVFLNKNFVCTYQKKIIDAKAKKNKYLSSLFLSENFRFFFSSSFFFSVLLISLHCYIFFLQVILSFKYNSQKKKKNKEICMYIFNTIVN